MDALAALRTHAMGRPSDVALTDGRVELCYGDVRARVSALATWMTDCNCRRLGLLLDNGLDWALLDLAARCADVVVVPIPLFFSAEQVLHVIAAAGLDHIATDQRARLEAIVGRTLAHAGTPSFVVYESTQLVKLDQAVMGSRPALPGCTQKVTFTSGTTGQPKGICLSHAGIDRVAMSLLSASEGRSDDRHLCLLPLATLLENIAGIYVPLLAGATMCIPPLSDVGLSGSSQLDVGKLLGALHRFRATTVVMVPQMLVAMIATLESGGRRPPTLRLIAVGGAPVSVTVLQAADRMGLPVRQGYGLSECSSVVCFNSVSDNRIGSVGRPLPHADVRIASDGEVLVRGAMCEGVLDEQETAQPLYWPTGDIGAFDADGYLQLTGRKKHMFITSFGRNLAPEWIECELTIDPAIGQAAVFGEGRPWNAGVLVPRAMLRGQAADPAQLTAAVQRVNARLPDYARIGRWIVADMPFTPDNQLMTANGRLRRDVIGQLYRDRMNRLYDDEALRVS